MNVRVQRYQPAYKQAWDGFVSSAKNGSFLFYRDFMEYHQDRFCDHSLLLFGEKSELLAVLVANEKDGSIHSHQGLTYGGLLLQNGEKIEQILGYWEVIYAYYQPLGFDFIYYKSIPAFYHQQPAWEEQYAFFLRQAEIYRVDTSFVVQPNLALPLQQRRRRAVQKAKKLGVEIRQSADCAEFWEQILSPNLQSRFGVNPVHSLSEIELLRARFPAHIIQYGAYLNGQMLAGTTLFCWAGVVHAQYISANDEGKTNGAIDLLFYELIHTIYPECRFFSFGIANENQGRSLNQGLVDWKEGFGTVLFPHLFYKIPLSASPKSSS